MVMDEGIVPMPRRLITRLEVEDFLYREAELLDTWQLDAWLALYTDDCVYEVTPPGVENADIISRAEVYFLIGDDRKRLEHRVIRLKRPNAHAEAPRSKVRHIYSNVVIAEDDGEEVTAYVNFLTFRTKRGTVEYFGRIRFELVREGAGAFRVRCKRVMMDMDNLVPQGRVSIIL